MKKFLPVVLLSVLIFTSGCTFLNGREVKTDANNGLIITEFSADPLTVEYSDSVLFYADIENVGGTTADTVKITLYGIKDIWKSGPDSSTVSSNPYKEESYLRPPDIMLNRPGDFKQWVWQCRQR